MMIASLHDLQSTDFDEIIDVRSPSEYAEDHVPKAINLPVLDNAERALVGTAYVQQSKFEARKMGAALVARNCARHLETYLADKGGSYRPLVYCWRGGQRSASLTTILRQIGWRAETIDGGYQTYRKFVWDALYNQPFPANVILLDGNTGTAKTDILKLLAGRGLQVMDLEGLANHRGSLFGAAPDGQPSQKAFETQLAQLCADLDDTQPVLLEAESSKIGQRTLPPSVWNAMKAAPRIILTAPLDERVRYVTNAYSDVVADVDRVIATLGRLQNYHSAAQIAEWKDLARAGAFEALARGLISAHYDPRYGKQRARNDDARTVHIDVPSLLPDGLEVATAEVARAVDQLVCSARLRVDISQIAS